MLRYVQKIKCVTTDRLHDYCCVTYPRYAAWHAYPYHRHTHWFLLLAFLVSWWGAIFMYFSIVSILVSRAANVWTVNTVDNSANDVGRFTSLVLDASGRPVVVYLDYTAKYLKLLHCNDANCAGGDESIVSVADVGPANSGVVMSLVLDSSGYPVVSYRYNASSSAGSLKLLHCNDANCAGGDESIMTVDATATNIGAYNSLRLDVSGFPVIAYTDSTNKGLKLAHCNDANCAGGDESLVTIETTTGASGFGYTSLQLDASRYPVMSYSDFSNKLLRLAHCNDANCAGGDESLVTVDSTIVVQFISLALDASGYPIMSYYNGANNFDLKLAHCNDANCAGGDESNVTVDSSGSVGGYSSLALTVDGNPVVSYYESISGDGNLKVVSCNDANCAGGDETIETPDTTNDTGLFTSLVLDASGYPVVSYEDYTNKDLKLAHAAAANTAPVVTQPSAFTQATDGSGTFTFQTTVSDADANAVKLKVEVKDNGGVFQTLAANQLALMSATNAAGISIATEGSGFHVQGIPTAAANTVTLRVDPTGIAGLDGQRYTDFQIRVTPHDGTTAGTAQMSATLVYDDASPTGLAQFTVGTPTITTMPLTWTAATEASFDHYEIWYGASQVDVQNRTGTANEWDNDPNDAALATVSTATTVITGLSVNAQHYFKLWAIDTLGNAAAVADIAAYTFAVAPGTPSLSNATSSSLTVVVDPATNPSSVTYAIEVVNGQTTSYVQSDSTLGASAVYRSYADWGGAAGTVVAGLTANTTYTVRVKAKNSAGTESSFSSPASGYTATGAPANFHASVVGATAITLAVDQFTNDATGQAGYRFTRTSPAPIATSNWQQGVSANSWTNTTLSPNTSYTYTAETRSAGGTISAVVPLTVVTLAATPVAPTVGNATTTTLDVTIGADTNPGTTAYAIGIGESFVQADGSIGESAVWQTNALWGTVTVRSLTPSTAYSIAVKARNSVGTETTSGVSASGRTNPTSNVEATTDQTPPSEPSSFVTTVTPEGIVLLTWNDPLESDLASIIVLRSEGNLPVSGDVYAVVAKGIGRYRDTRVTPGITYNYLLKVTDVAGNGMVTAVKKTVTIPAQEQLLEKTQEEVKKEAESVLPSSNMNLRRLLITYYPDRAVAAASRTICDPANKLYQCSEDGSFRVKQSGATTGVQIATVVSSSGKSVSTLRGVAFKKATADAKVVKILGRVGRMYDLIDPSRAITAALPESAEIVLLYSPQWMRLLLSSAQQLAVARHDPATNAWQIVRTTTQNSQAGTFTLTTTTQGSYTIVIVEGR